MKKLIFLLPVLATPAIAATPESSLLVACPVGMTQVVFSSGTLRGGLSCNSGESLFESGIARCTSSSSARCWLFVDNVEEISDGKGVFKFNGATGVCTDFTP